jgi:hypothetical protein
MAVGLVMAFYLFHVRLWIVPVNDGRGRLNLWVGGSSSKNREQFEEAFQEIVAQIRSELESGAAVSANTAQQNLVRA